MHVNVRGSSSFIVMGLIIKKNTSKSSVLHFFRLDHIKLNIFFHTITKINQLQLIY